MVKNRAAFDDPLAGATRRASRCDRGRALTLRCTARRGSSLGRLIGPRSHRTRGGFSKITRCSNGLHGVSPPMLEFSRGASGSARPSVPTRGGILRKPRSSQPSVHFQFGTRPCGSFITMDRSCQAQLLAEARGARRWVIDFRALARKDAGGDGSAPRAACSKRASAALRG